LVYELVMINGNYEFLKIRL